MTGIKGPLTPTDQILALEFWEAGQELGLLANPFPIFRNDGYATPIKPSLEGVAPRAGPPHIGPGLGIPGADMLSV